VDAIGIIMMGAGVFIMYAAYKNAHPITVFQSVLGTASGGTK